MYSTVWAVSWSKSTKQITDQNRTGLEPSTVVYVLVHQSLAGLPGMDADFPTT